MSYTISRYNREILTTVDEGTLDRTTDLIFIGKNYSGYGEITNENFLYLLENFSGENPPGKAVSGQLWYDTESQKIRVYNDLSWRKLGVTTTNDTEPTGQVLGDFWWDTAKDQLYAYNGSTHELVGPERAGPNITRMVSLEVTDIEENSHYIITAVANGRTIFVISETEFQLSTESAIDGFSVIKKGITLVDSSNATGVTSSDHWFWGTVSNAEKLDDLNSTQFLRSDVNTALTGEFTFNTQATGLNWLNGDITVKGYDADAKLELATRTSDEIIFKAGSTETLKITPDNNLLGLTFRGSTVWTQANDGSGSGLDADLLDGLDSTQYLRSDVDTALTGEFVFTDQGTGLNWVNNNITIKGYDVGQKLEFTTRSNDDVVFTAGSTETLKIVPESGSLGLTYRGATVWTSANDGPGSGLNADRLDGYSHEDFLKVNAKAVDSDLLDGLDSTAFLQRTGGTMTGNITFSDNQEGIVWTRNTDGASIKFYNVADGDSNSRLEFNIRDNGNEDILFTSSLSGGGTTELLRISPDGGQTGLKFRGNTVWHAGNDGSGSGLNADLLDGYNHTDFLKVNGKAVDSALADYAQNSNRLDGYNHTDFLKVNGKAVDADKADYATYANNANLLDGYNNTAFLRKAVGGTLGNYLTLHADPVNSKHAATKGYVDEVVGNIDPYWAGETTFASVKASYANFPVNTRVSFWQVRSFTRSSGNGGSYTFYDRFRRTVKKTGSNTWVDVGG